MQRPGTIRAGWQSQVPELRYLLSVMAGVVQNELGMEGQIFSNKLLTWFLARFYSTSPVPPPPPSRLAEIGTSTYFVSIFVFF